MPRLPATLWGCGAITLIRFNSSPSTILGTPNPKPQWVRWGGGWPGCPCPWGAGASPPEHSVCIFSCLLWGVVALASELELLWRLVRRFGTQFMRGLVQAAFFLCQEWEEEGKGGEGGKGRGSSLNSNNPNLKGGEKYKLFP